MTEYTEVEQPFLQQLLPDYRERKGWLRVRSAELDL
jgi:hypothetical protein